jgi:hypothetical protein
MGLHTFVRFRNESYEIPEEIAVCFNELTKYDIAGYEVRKYLSSLNMYNISLYGRNYVSFLNDVTDIWLDFDIFYELETLKYAYDCLSEFIEKKEEYPNISLNEMVGLKEFFRICYENGLQIYSI